MDAEKKRTCTKVLIRIVAKLMTLLLKQSRMSKGNARLLRGLTLCFWSCSHGTSNMKSYIYIR